MYTDQLCIDSTTKRSSFCEGSKISCSKNGTVRVVILHDPKNEAKDHVAPDPNEGGSAAVFCACILLPVCIYFITTLYKFIEKSFILFSLDYSPKSHTSIYYIKNIL